MRRGLAIDLGTANTLVWSESNGIVVNEPSVVAMDQRSGEVLAMGHEAYAMIEGAPGHLVAHHPLRGGAVTDFDTTAQMLKLLFQRVRGGRIGRFGKPRVVICVPSTLTNLERRAVEEAATKAGAGEVHLMEEPMAAAIGAGLPVQEPRGCMVVDVGGGTSGAATVAMGGVVASVGVRVGGFDLDSSVQRYLRDTYALTIGERTAEELKIAIGSAFPQESEPHAEVHGRELASGLPRVESVGASEMRAAIDHQIASIMRAVVQMLGECPSELAQDVWDDGMWLVGGGALLAGLDARITAESQLPVNVAEQPLEAVVAGAGTVIESVGDLQALFDGTGSDVLARR